MDLKTDNAGGADPVMTVAPHATGNIATEDLVYLLDGEGVSTGVDLGALIGVSAWLETVLGRRLDGQVYRAGPFPSAS